MSTATARNAIGTRARVTRRVAAPHRAGLFGLGWAGLAQLVGLLIRLGSNLILTRLLAPEAYGLFGTAMAVVTTLEWLSDLGVQPALIRHPEGTTARYLNTGWWLSFGRGLALSAVAGSLAWPLAQIYGQPGLFPILLVLALRPALLALRSPGIPRLRRELNYRALFWDETAQTIAATAVSLALAWWTHSLWSIVLGTLTGGLVGVLVSFCLCPVRPRAGCDPAAVREIASLGRQVFGNTLVMALWLNLDRLLGLRFVGEKEMGYYAVAWNLAMVAEGLMTRGCDVYFSILSRHPEDEPQSAWHRLVTRRVAVWGMPVGALGVLLAPLAIALLYDQRYAAAQPLFAILMARFLFRLLGQVQFQYLLARAEVRLATRAYGVALIVQAALVPLLAQHFGARGLAFSALVSTAVLTGTQSLLLELRGRNGLMPFCVTLGWAAVALAVAVR